MTLEEPLNRGRRPKRATGKLGKSEAFQFRIDPMSRFAIELAARYQKRTLSSAFDIAVENYIQCFTIKYREGQILSFTQDSDTEVSLTELVKEVWHSDESLRFIKLAQRYPVLLSIEERLIWEVIQAEPVFWRISPRTNDPELYVDFIRALWDELKNMDPDEGLKSIDFKDVLIMLQDQSKPEKIAALRQALDDLYPNTDFDFSSND